MKFQQLGQVSIQGVKWVVGYGFPGTTNGKTDDGCCNYKQRRIIINRRSTRSLVDVLAHEAIHARFPDLAEAAVDDCATIIGQVHDLFSKQSD